MTTNTDLGRGLGIAFSLVAVLAALGTAVLGYQYAVVHAAEGGGRTIQINAGLAFGAAVVASIAAVAVVHVYGD